MVYTSAEPANTRKVSSNNSYSELKARVKAAGLLETQGRYYAIKIAYTLALFVIGVALLFALSGWWRLLVAPYLAFVSAQMGFLAHDLGHKQVFASNKVNTWTGMIISNLLTGMGLGWWNDKHNAHHANPNHDGLDPDIDIPFMAFSEDQALSKRGLARVFVAQQAWLFFPALTFTVYSMQVSALRYMFSERYKWQIPDAALLWGHFALYYIGLPLLLGPWLGLAFILIHRGLLGIMIGSVFAPNHKGMLVIGKDEEQLDFLRRQVLTSRNVRSTPLLDFLYGGLNHQAVHHLFPNMPRNKLAAAGVITKQFCEEQDITYYMTGVRQSFSEILQCLHDTAAPLRRNGSSGDTQPDVALQQTGA